MIKESTLKFLDRLKNNNNKSWFDENRGEYEIAKADFFEFTKKLIKGLEKIDNNIALTNMDPKKCISRINRDFRFSKNKSPYKTSLSALIKLGGKNSNKAGYYFLLENGNQSFTGGGVFMPEPANLQLIRQEIDYGFEEWKTIVEGKSFKKMYPKGVQSYETLVRTPKGYEENNPAVDYLKMKGFYTLQKYSDEVLQSNDCIKKILQDFATAKPMIDFLNKALV